MQCTQAQASRTCGLHLAQPLPQLLPVCTGLNPVVWTCGHARRRGQVAAGAGAAERPLLAPSGPHLWGHAARERAQGEAFVPAGCVLDACVSISAPCGRCTAFDVGQLPGLPACLLTHLAPTCLSHSLDHACICHITWPTRRPCARVCSCRPPACLGCVLQPGVQQADALHPCAARAQGMCQGVPLEIIDTPGLRAAAGDAAANAQVLQHIRRCAWACGGQCAGAAAHTQVLQHIRRCCSTYAGAHGHAAANAQVLQHIRRCAWALPGCVGRQAGCAALHEPALSSCVDGTLSAPQPGLFAKGWGSRSRITGLAFPSHAKEHHAQALRSLP